MSSKINKKQKIVTWVTAIILIVVSVVIRRSATDYLAYISYIYLPIVALGILLAYLLRDKK
jgi:hypothetical protein